METFKTYKPATVSNNGIVVSQNRRAAAAGAAVLRQGGNAIDAAVVTVLVLSVVEPWMSGIGGGGFLLRADGGSGEVSALGFNVTASSKAQPLDYPIDGDAAIGWFGWPPVVDDRNLLGYSSIAVPGTVAGLAEALRKFGTLRWADALSPAIAEAKRGLEIDWYGSLFLAMDAGDLAKFPESRATFLRNGMPPVSGEMGQPVVLALRKKAELLTQLATRGWEDFYRGELAQSIVSDLAEGGSSVTAEDMAGYQAEWLKPVYQRYRDFDVFVIPGLSGGPTLLDALKRLADAKLHAGTDRAQAALAYADAIRGAYDRRLETMGHAATNDPGCTSHVSVVDKSGTLVSVTNTLLSRFGSKVVLPGSGLLMNNGMMWFDPVPGRANSIAPGVQPLANMCPLILKKGQRAVAALGAAGGRTIFPNLLQIISAIGDFGLSIEDALSIPRIDASTPKILISSRDQEGVLPSLAARYEVEVVDEEVHPARFGRPGAIVWESDSFVGMSHPFSPWAAAISA
jgi:gamma-glutamyltranspeptidase / glutathione hydrolase